MLLLAFSTTEYSHLCVEPYKNREIPIMKDILHSKSLRHNSMRHTRHKILRTVFSTRLSANGSTQQIMLCNSSQRKMPKQRDEVEGRSSDSTIISYSRLLPLLKSTYLSLLVSLLFGQEMPEMLVSSWKCALIRTEVNSVCLTFISLAQGKGSWVLTEIRKFHWGTFPPTPPTGPVVYEEMYQYRTGT